MSKNKGIRQGPLFALITIPSFLEYGGTSLPKEMEKAYKKYVKPFEKDLFKQDHDERKKR